MDQTFKNKEMRDVAHFLTWVHLLIAGHSIDINNVLEASSEFIGANESWGVLGADNPMDKGLHSRTAALL